MAAGWVVPRISPPAPQDFRAWVNRISRHSFSGKPSDRRVLKIENVRVLRGGRLVDEDLWVKNGRVIDPRARFWEANRGREFYADQVRRRARPTFHPPSTHSHTGSVPPQIIDGRGCVAAPGFLDVQINGACGVDFSSPDLAEKDVTFVAQWLLRSGVTGFCPTVVTSSPATYAAVLPKLARRPASVEVGAAVLGAYTSAGTQRQSERTHTPTHPLLTPLCLRRPRGGSLPQPAQVRRPRQELPPARGAGNSAVSARTSPPPPLPAQGQCSPDAAAVIPLPGRRVERVYGSLENVAVVTAAPEVLGVTEVTRELRDKVGPCFPHTHTHAHTQQTHRTLTLPYVPAHRASGCAWATRRRLWRTACERAGRAPAW